MHHIQTPLGRLQHSSRPLAGFKGPTSKRRGGSEKREMMGREGRKEVPQPL